MSVIIIESPNKKDKIQKISGFETFATIGHFKDLPNQNYLAWDTYEPNFDFKSEEAKKRMNFIFSKCKDEEVFIATDPDREGYAIGFMFYLVIKNIAKSIKRAEFHEITEAGIKKGLSSAVEFSKTNFNEFEAFKARSVGDKLVGFILSPKYISLLNDKNTSIGRVQTPALNLIVSREKELLDFNNLDESKKLSYKLKALLSENGVEFEVKNDNVYENKDEAENALKLISNAKSAILNTITSKESKKAPPQPFRTSQLQQIANQAFGFSSDECMLLAQNLFERGLITYIRTDSNALSAEFLDEVESFYKDKEWYQKREYKAGKQSQAQAHEAIRITHIHSYEQIDEVIKKANDEIKDAKKLSDNHKKLYTLIYLNSVLSQAKDCVSEVKKYEFSINAMTFIIQTSKITYKGFKGVFDKENDEDEEKDENISTLDLSFLKEGQDVEIKELNAQEIKKQAPSRYKESSFISLLEKEGIGRPSTYASFLPTLLKRNYIELVKKGKNKEITPTPKGMKAIELLLENDEWVTKSEYTKQMEEMLEAISSNQLKYIDFVKPLHQKMGFKNTDLSSQSPSEKQIELLKKLAKDQNKEVPQNAFENAQECKKLIDSLIKTSPKKPPSDKQISLAKSLAEKNKLELPKDYDKDMSICSKFIDSVFKKGKK